MLVKHVYVTLIKSFFISRPVPSVLASGYPKALSKSAGSSLSFLPPRAMSTRDSQRHHRRSRSPRNCIDSPSSRSRRRSFSPHTQQRYGFHQQLIHDKPSGPVVLPFDAPPLSKHDFESYKPIFSLYLDIQKQLVLEELPANEVKGRWKSFVGKWYVRLA